VREVFYSRVRLEDIRGNAPMRLYVGLAGGIPVATSVLYQGAGVAGVYMVATLQDRRGRGFGTAMTVAPLLDARHEGARVAVLQASGAGLRIYERIGFKSFGTFDIYQ
jgi:predicted GNAT family acetyltransferase